MVDDVFKVLVMGDFCGTFTRNRPAPKLKLWEIDRDNFDELMGVMDVSVELDGERLTFAELDDFDPDRLVEKLGLLNGQQSAPPPTGDLLGAILAEQGEEKVEAEDAPVSLRDAANFSEFVERIAAAHVVPAKDAATVKRELDQAELAGVRLRAILHDPKFQAMEAAWRGLYRLVRGVETGPDLKIYLLDITLPELVVSADALRDTLQETGPWAVLAGNYAFGQSGAEIRALEKIAEMGRAVEAPFLAEGLPGDLTEGWTEFRKSPEAVWIGLAMPRFLLRLPYGKKSIPIDSFDFEEMPVSEHTEYLWGNPVFAGVGLLMQGFGMDEIPRRVEDLPVHTYSDGLEAVAKPCAEVWMSHRDAERLLEQGWMPLASVKGQDVALWLRFQSVADPLQGLPGF